MRGHWARRIVLVVALFGVSDGAGTEARAQYSRRTPIVEAVAKTRGGIVRLQVEKPGQDEQPCRQVGSGVLVDERGYLVTNRHVVTEATKIRVRLADGTVLPAEVVKEDESCDLAILRVRTEKKLQALPLGPGSDLLVGETVVAVGHPFGYTDTVSTGIVSALGREITLPTGAVLRNLIQTNASINPGNSGGPLLNINGELIGINVALRSGAQGIAFAINADMVKEALCRHLSTREVAGVDYGLTCGEAVVPEGPRRQRVVVDAIGRQSLAAAAGLERGDEIVRVAERPVCNRFDVERALWDRKPGEQVPVTVVRQGQEKRLLLTLPGEAAGERVAASGAALPR
jgi:serine protease Do